MTTNFLPRLRRVAGRTGHRPAVFASALGCVLTLAACAGGAGRTAQGPTAAELDAQARQLMQTSFRSEGIASIDRLQQDADQAACSALTPPSPDVIKRLEAQALATVQWPEGGQFFGDFREGEKIAQDGRGMTWTDKSMDPASNGGNCYNCHQIDKKEISFGTIGPSLWNYGTLRGVKRLDDPASAPIIRYTWARLWNAKAFNACSTMPRFGAHKLLNATQLQHLMSLLLDPRSPVNQ